MWGDSRTMCGSFPSERVDVLMRFLTHDTGRETGRTQRSQDEEEEPYTMKTKTSPWKTRGGSQIFWWWGPMPCGEAVNNNTDLCPASCCSPGSAPRLDVPTCSCWVWTSRTRQPAASPNTNYTTCFNTVHVWKQLLIKRPIFVLFFRRSNGVDELLKLAKQFDFNMFRQDEEEKKKRGRPAPAESAAPVWGHLGFWERRPGGFFTFAS